MPGPSTLRSSATMPMPPMAPWTPPEISGRLRTPLWPSLRQAAAANGVQLAARAFLSQWLRCGTLSSVPAAGSTLPSLRRCGDSHWQHWQAGSTARLRPNTTSLLLHYVGHGAITGWAGQPVLLQSADIADLGLAPHLPVVLDMTCYTGYFQFPGLQSMAEAWLSSPQHGAVAVIASSGLDLVEAHAAFDAALLSEFAGQASTTIGQAFLSAKLAAAAAGLLARCRYVSFVRRSRHAAVDGRPRAHRLSRSHSNGSCADEPGTCHDACSVAHPACCPTDRADLGARPAARLSFLSLFALAARRERSARWLP